MAKKKANKAANRPVKPTSNAKGPAQKQIHKERGTLLTVLLALIFLHSVVATYLGYITLKDEYARTTWVLPLMTLVSVAGIVAAMGMWYWKQWGITLYAITCVIQAAVHLMLTGSLLVVFYDLLPVSILAYVINLQSKKNLFE
ncbi:MAG TPA: hypothetical protein VJ785_04475 [Anaerolineales bacterium]|nr:hypothetical protein [Anaerolineales bacterium]